MQGGKDNQGMDFPLGRKRKAFAGGPEGEGLSAFKISSRMGSAHPALLRRFGKRRRFVSIERFEKNP